MADSVALRLQRTDQDQQALILGEVASRRVGGRISPGDVEDLFHEFAIPLPGRVSNRFAALERSALLSRAPGRGRVWAVTPEGRHEIGRLFTREDLHHLSAEMALAGGSDLGTIAHPVIPPVLAPPVVAGGVAEFIEQYPFETNVFAMTRFPSETDPDPLQRAIEAAREVCAGQGLNLMLASDQAIVDDLWANVTAHMWASKYGIAFFEDRATRGINHNMTIEVGAMLMTGRRCAVLKDQTIDKLPTDLVGHIYRSVDFGDLPAIGAEVEAWITKDLRIA
jgi:hypothetical protein